MVHGQYIIIALQTQDFGKESRFFLKGSRFYLYRYQRKPVYNKLTNETEEQHRFQKKMEDMKMKKKLAVVLAASMAAVSLAACGGSGSSAPVSTAARRKAEARRERIPRQPQVRRLKIRRQQLPATRP